jgi:hypothetical protein
MHWAAAALVLAAAGSAQAAYTSFGSSGEPSLYSIFSSNYGAPGVTQATFEGTGSQAAFTFGAYTFTRVNDSGGSTPTDIHALVAPSTNDERFMDGSTDVKFTVKHAGNSNTMGWADQTGGVTAISAGNFTSILGDTTPGASATVTLSTDFQLALRSSGTYWGSNSGTNSDTSDHLMTGFVTGAGRTFFVIAWEDLPIGGGADRDYNDWVGELQVVPLPPAAWAGISSLVGVAGFGVIRRRRLRAS